MSRTLIYQLIFFSNLFNVAKSCSETQCLVFGKEKDVSSKFQFLLEDKGVRVVYFKLDFASDSYNSLYPDRIIPGRWTWAQINSEPLLSLSFDYDVLSLGLLKNQAKDLILDLTSTQRQCLKALNSSCYYLEIARGLFDITYTSPKKAFKMADNVVCFRMLREHWFGIGSHFKYHCCKRNILDNNNGTSIDCNVSVSESKWLAAFNAILAILVGVTVLYWPWMFSLLPNSIFTDETQDSVLQNEPESSCAPTMSSSRDLPLDDYSPVTLQEFFKKLGDFCPNNIFDLRVRLFFVWFGFIPIFFYIKVFLYLIIKGPTNFDETSRKLLFQVADYYFFVFNMERPLVYVLFIVPFFAFPCVAILLAPKQINSKSVIEAISKSTEKIKEHLVNIIEIGQSFISDFLLSLSTSKVFGNSTCCKKPIASLYSVAYIVVVVPVCIVTAVVMFLIASVLCLAVFSPYSVFLLKLLRSNKFSLHHRIFFTISTFSATILVTFSCQFVVRMLGFVIMGTILNAEFVLPYVTFVFAVGSNIYLCFSNSQKKYKELKDLIAEKWMEHGDRIPEKLFWYVSDKVRPISNEILLLFCKIIAIVVFLSVALTAILLFKITYEASAVVPTISVFITGKLSELFFTGVAGGYSLVGWDKIRVEEKIIIAIEEYKTLPKAEENDVSERATTYVCLPNLV